MYTALIAFVTCLVYATLRYNVFKGVPWEQWPLYVTNKAFALGALALLPVLLWRRLRERPDGGLHTWIAAFLGIHVVLSLCQLTPQVYGKYFADGRLTFAASLSWLLGAVATFGLWKACRRCELGKGDGSLVLGLLSFLVGVHAAVLGYGGWFTPAKWPGGLLPITLVSFILGCVALVLALMHRQAARASLGTAAVASGAVILALVGATWLLTQQQPKADQAVVVFCGGSMRGPVDALAASTTPAPRIDYGGSETLLPRVIAGAPADVLVTHDPFPAQLADKGLLRSETVVGELVPVLIVAKGNPKGLTSLRSLSASGVRVGMTDPRYSTCGEYVRDEVARQGLTAAIEANTTVLRRSHQELATDLRLGVIDAALVWNFAAALNREQVDTVALDHAWPTTRVVLCGLKTGTHAAATDRLLASWGSATGLAMFSAHGYSKLR